MPGSHPLIATDIIDLLEALVSKDIVDGLHRLDLREELSAVEAFREAVGMITKGFQSIGSSDNLAISFALSDNESSILKQLRTALKSVDISRLRDFISPSSDNSLPEIQILTDILQLHEKYQNLIRFHNAFETLFFDRPFQVSARNLYGLQPREEQLTLRFNPAWFDRHSTIMKNLGQIWVDYHLSAVTVEEIERVQISLIQNISRLIDQELFAFKSVLPETEALLLDIKAAIEKEVARVNNKKFTVAFCGMVKAGKSLFLNALTGTSILPSDELPSTAWPCRVQHVKNQNEPILEVDSAYFQDTIDILKNHKFDVKINSLEDEDDEDNPWGDIQDGSDIDLDLTAHSNWIDDLHPTTKRNLLRFQEDNYHLPSSARGHKDVSDLLAQVNDVVRLCSKLNVAPPSQKPGSWPLLRVEFESLQGKHVSDDFEFIDLPGLGESTDDDKFENLVRVVAKEANAIVPIVSFKEASRHDWRQLLPDIIRNGLGRAPDLVLCTHLDQVAKDRVEQQVSSVAAVFWPNRDDSIHRVLPCSSRMGISARALLRKSMEGKPKFSDIWVEDHVAYDCAEKLLGAAIPRKKLEQYGVDDWQEDVLKELKDSKLESAVKCLTKEIVMKERSHILILEGRQLHIKIKKLIDDQRHLVLGMRRSTQELDDAYHAFTKLSLTFKQVLQNWHTEESRIKSDSIYVFQRAFQLFEAQALDVAMQAIENTLHEVHWREKVEQLEGANDLMFHHKSDIESFLISIQQEMRTLLAPIKRNFVASVRQLANQSHMKLFDSLKATIQQSVEDDVQIELIEDITDQLDSHSHEIESLLLSNIKKKVVHTVSKAHDMSTAYRGTHHTIAKPLLCPTSQDSSLEVNATNASFAGTEYSGDMSSFKTSERAGDIGQLGFMLRAPVATLAVLLGSGFRRFIHRILLRSKTYVLSKSALSSELQEHVICPYFKELGKEGRFTLDGIITKSSQAARTRVENSLEEEKRRFIREKDRRSAREQELKALLPSMSSAAPSTDLATSSMTILLNLLAAETGLLKLQTYLKDVPLFCNK